MSDALEELTERLERAAARLRAGDLEADVAAELVSDCAGLAAQAASELERRAQGSEAPPPGAVPPGQAELGI